VPVGALVALAEGGYGVQVIEGSTARYIAVKTGMFAGGRGRDRGRRHQGAHARGGAQVIVEPKSVSKLHPGGVTVLSGASLKIERGELVGIVGPSGSGKSTMLNVVGTLDRPSSGTVRVDGYGLASLSDREFSALRAGTIGSCSSSSTSRPAYRHWTTWRMGCSTRAYRCESGGGAVAALRRVGLEHRLEHEPHELSGGRTAAGRDRPGRRERPATAACGRAPETWTPPRAPRLWRCCASCTRPAPPCSSSPTTGTSR